MYKVILPLFLILAGSILCLNRNYPKGYMSTPSYPRQTMDRHFAMINMIRDTESKIKLKSVSTAGLTNIGIVFLVAGLFLSVIFYFI